VLSSNGTVLIDQPVETNGTGISLPSGYKEAVIVFTGDVPEGTFQTYFFSYAGGGLG
jgi:hypothetical protein